jgi:type I restriction enzyme S subunit
MVSLGDILKIEQDEVLLKPDETYRTAGIYSFGRGVFERQPILGADTSYTSLFRLHENQFILSRLNGWEGAVDVVSAELDGCLVSNEYPTFAIASDLAYPGYLRWITRWSKFWEQLVPRGSMVRRKRVKPGQLLEVEIPLPPMTEQRHVAWRLDRIQTCVIDVTQRSIQAADLTAALSVSISARPDLGDAVKKDLGWKRTRLGSVMHMASDVLTVEVDGSYPNVGIYSFGRGLFKKPDIDGGRTSAKVLNRVHAGQFIYSRLFAFEGAYGFVPPSFDKYVVSNEFPTFDSDPALLDVRWLANYLRSPDRWAELAGSSKGLGVRRQRVPVEAVLAYEVWLPPIDQQHAMVRAAESLEAVRQARVQSDQRAKSLVAAALNRAFAELAQQSAPNGHRRR